MDHKSKLKALVSNAGKSAKNLLENTVRSADQNDDGKFNLSDVSIIAESVGSSLKKGAQAVKENADETARLLELKALQPIFPSTMSEADFLMPKFIRVLERDKRHAESAVCQGSIGYTSNQKGLRIVNIFRDSVDAFGLTFYPDSDCEFYYVDPSDRDHYISLDDYFGHLKEARVAELQKLAQDLGAKYFRITYKEEQTSFTEKSVDSHIRAGMSLDATHEVSSKKYSTVEIAAESEFPGHSPVQPQLKYLQRDASIQNLIAMRMDESAPLITQKFMLKMSNSSGMKETDAGKIDAVLKGLKCSGNTTVESEAKNEARRYLEYEIKF